MAQGLVCNGVNTRARRVLSNIWPFTAISGFALSIRLRGLRVSHPTRQRLMVAPGIALSIENGELRLTTTLPAGGDCALPLGGATDGEVSLARSVDSNRGVSTFRLRFTTRAGALVGEVYNEVAYTGNFQIAGGAGLSFAADNAANVEHLQVVLDDFRFLLNLSGDGLGLSLNHGSNGGALRYGFAGNGDDARAHAQHLTVENGSYEQTPEVLAVAADASRAVFSGITPEPGFTIRLFHRTQAEVYDYTRPLEGGYDALPFSLSSISNRNRLFFVTRLHDEATGVDGPDSNEVGILPPVPPAAAGEALVTFDDALLVAGRYSGQGPQLIAEDRYRAEGLLISAAPAFGPFVSPWALNHTPYGALCASTRSDFASVQADAPVTLNFVVPGTAQPAHTGMVKFFVCGTESGQTATWRAVAYNSAGAALQTIEGTTDSEVVFTRGPADIARVVFTPSVLSPIGGPSLSGYEMLDTLRFNNPTAL